MKSKTHRWQNTSTTAHRSLGWGNGGAAVRRTEIDALRKGGPEALDSFYRAYGARVLGWAIRLGGPKLDHEDVAQEVFAIALAGLDGFKGESSINTWLFSITRNVISNTRRKARWSMWSSLSWREETADTGPWVDETTAQLRMRRRIQRALQRLSVPHREVLVLMDLEERTASEVSEMLGVPVGTIYSRLHHARRYFAKALRKEGVSPNRDRRVVNLGQEAK